MKATARSTRDVRIINVSSNAHRFGKIELPLAQKFYLRKTYGSTKLANILNAFYLARLVKDDGITVNAVHPGVVATDLWRNLPKIVSTIAKKFMLSAKQGAAPTIALASVEKLESTGQYYELSQPAKPAAIAYDEELQKQLFGETKKMVKEYLIG
jgi:retinol dehydrogenase-12/retinol dehydrogenase-13